jgi:hypothetical protein
MSGIYNVNRLVFPRFQEVAQLTLQLAEQRRSVEASINYLKQRTLQEAPSRDEEEMAAKIGDLERELQGIKEERAEALDKVQVVEVKEGPFLSIWTAVWLKDGDCWLSDITKSGRGAVQRGGSMA